MSQKQSKQAHKQLHLWGFACGWGHLLENHPLRCSRILKPQNGLTTSLWFLTSPLTAVPRLWMPLIPCTTSSYWKYLEWLMLFWLKPQLIQSHTQSQNHWSHSMFSDDEESWRKLWTIWTSKVWRPSKADFGWISRPCPHFQESLLLSSHRKPTGLSLTFTFSDTA